MRYNNKRSHFTSTSWLPNLLTLAFGETALYIVFDSKYILHQNRLSGCRVLTGVITESSVSRSIFQLARLFYAHNPIATFPSLWNSFVDQKQHCGECCDDGQSLLWSMDGDAQLPLPLSTGREINIQNMCLAMRINLCGIHVGWSSV